MNCTNCGLAEYDRVMVSGGKTVKNGPYLACPECGVFEAVP